MMPASVRAGLLEHGQAGGDTDWGAIANAGVSIFGAIKDLTGKKTSTVVPAPPPASTPPPAAPAASEPAPQTDFFGNLTAMKVVGIPVMFILLALLAYFAFIR